MFSSSSRGSKFVAVAPFRRDATLECFHSSFKLKQIQTPVTSTLTLKSGEQRTAVEAYKDTSDALSETFK